jgi:hypothetical protein
MTKELQQKMNEEIAKLPRYNQEAINSIDWDNISWKIGKSNLLTESEINDLQIETGLVLIGLSELDLFVINVEKNTGTTKVQSEKIAKEIYEEIFKPIAEKMEVMVKDKIKSQNPKWDQRINFIISGGDYSNFV